MDFKACNSGHELQHNVISSTKTRNNSNKSVDKTKSLITQLKQKNTSRWLTLIRQYKYPVKHCNKTWLLKQQHRKTE